MRHRSSVLNAAIRAVQGEFDRDIEMSMFLDNWRLAPVLAFAPDADPVMRALAALFLGATELLSASIIAHPALHDAVARSIWTNAGISILASWAEIAPKGWGTRHAAALIKAARWRERSQRIAAALIGPCDMAAQLLDVTEDIADAIRRWGQATPESPTAWMNALSSGERNRLLNAIQRFPSAAASCLPWLPPDMAARMRIDAGDLTKAIDAFAVASPFARARHASLVERLVGQAQPDDLDALTRLACAMMSEEVWARAATLVQQSPDDASRVVAAAPWDDLDATVRAAILERADSDICIAIAAAQGHTVAERITHTSALAFFAALDPQVWDALASDERRRWHDALPNDAAHLAVRSLGPRPEILAKAAPGAHVVRAVQRSSPDDAALRWTLLPVALRALDPDAAYVLFAALPTPPPDPGAFFFIAGGRSDPSLLARIGTTVRTENDLAIVFALQRNATGDESVCARCAALQDALRGRTWDDLAPYMPLLDAEDRAALTPDLDALAQRLAHSKRMKKMRHALERLASLPPEVVVPSFIALNRLESPGATSAAEAIASALRAHGDLFMDMVDAMSDGYLGDELLPLPKDAALADTLRALAHDDPPTAHLLGHALRAEDWRAATETVLQLPAHHRPVWTPATDALVARFAHPDQREALRHALDRLTSLPPDVDLLVRFALDMGTNRNRIAAAEDIARALRAHGDVFLAMVNALADRDLRAVLLPLSENAALADALRALAHDDPPTAHRLGHALRVLTRDNPPIAHHMALALRNGVWHTALRTLLTAPPRHADAVWQALDDAARSTMVAAAARASSDVDPIALGHPLTALALAAFRSTNAELRNAGAAALAARADALRVMWGNLTQETQHAVRAHPSLAPIVADIPLHAPPPDARRLRNR